MNRLYFECSVHFTCYSKIKNICGAKRTLLRLFVKIDFSFAVDERSKYQITSLPEICGSILVQNVFACHYFDLWLLTNFQSL